MSQGPGRGSLFGGPKSELDLMKEKLTSYGIKAKDMSKNNVIRMFAEMEEY